MVGFIGVALNLVSLQRLLAAAGVAFYVFLSVGLILLGIWFAVHAHQKRGPA